MEKQKKHRSVIHWDTILENGRSPKNLPAPNTEQKKRICKRCNEYEIDVIDPTGHQHTKIIDKKAATCEEKGYSGDLYCEDCRVIIQLGQKIAATGHTWDNGEITKEPTQTQQGSGHTHVKQCPEDQNRDDSDVKRTSLG